MVDSYLESTRPESEASFSLLPFAALTWFMLSGLARVRACSHAIMWCVTFGLRTRTRWLAAIASPPRSMIPVHIWRWRGSWLGWTHANAGSLAQSRRLFDWYRRSAFDIRSVPTHPIYTIFEVFWWNIRFDPIFILIILLLFILWTHNLIFPIQNKNIFGAILIHWSDNVLGRNSR